MHGARWLLLLLGISVVAGIPSHPRAAAVGARRSHGVLPFIDDDYTRAVAEAYLKYWYTKEGQEIAARNSYRPRDSEIAREYEKSFARVELFTIDDVFGGWTKAQKDHFAEGGIFDQIYKN